MKWGMCKGLMFVATKEPSGHRSIDHWVSLVFKADIEFFNSSLSSFLAKIIFYINDSLTSCLLKVIFWGVNKSSVP